MTSLHCQGGQFRIITDLYTSGSIYGGVSGKVQLSREDRPWMWATPFHRAGPRVSNKKNGSRAAAFVTISRLWSQYDQWPNRIVGNIIPSLTPRTASADWVMLLFSVLLIVGVLYNYLILLFKKCMLTYVCLHWFKKTNKRESLSTVRNDLV